MDTRIYRASLDTPYGQVRLAVDAGGVLLEVWLPGRGCRAHAPVPAPPAARAGIDAAIRQLAEYFSGERHVFDLPIDPRGSAFERRVWQRLLAIPYGETTSYGAIARELGLVNGSRAVGRANGANPIPIVIPCHRVIGTDGRLTGFGGGLPLKRALLELEGVIAPLDPTLF